jgi:hypothetical protein
MIVHILYSSILFKLTRKSYDKLEFGSDIKLKDVINAIVNLYGTNIEHEIYNREMNELKVPVFRNGKKIYMEDSVGNEDRLIFTFIISGG